MAVNYTALHATSWMLNRAHALSAAFSAETDVQRSEQRGAEWAVEYSGLPSYDTLVTAAVLEALNARPKAASDFVGGKSSAVPGQRYAFGADIGYDSRTCSAGYWPPGSVCPRALSGAAAFSLRPTRDAALSHSVGAGMAGLFVNGAGIHGFRDGGSYRAQGAWESLASEFERWDVDLCEGRADPSGAYHHHHAPRCLLQQLEPNASLHSPVIGWLGDGFPLHGPWHGGALAQSCWQTRDYASRLTGCRDGRRSCILNDNTDPSAGVYELPPVLHGPDEAQLLPTPSGNAVPARSGVFYQDLFFNASCFALGGARLNANNGHAHGDLGFHYHATLTPAGRPAFPYLVGPKYYGAVYAPYSAVWRAGVIAGMVLAFVVVFYTASVICDEYLVPSVEVFIVQFKIPEELAAVTLVAFGNAAPELMLDTLGAIRSKASISLPTTLGSAMIAFGLIPAACVLACSDRLFVLSAVPILREVSFYVAGLFVFLLVIHDGFIQLYEALLLTSVYVVYVGTVFVFYLVYANSQQSTLLPSDEESIVFNDASVRNIQEEDEDEEADETDLVQHTDTSEADSACWRCARRSFNAVVCPVRRVIVTFMPSLKVPPASSKVRVPVWRAVLVLVLSVLLVGYLSNLIIDICGVVIEELDVDPSILGATLVAIGAEIPDTFSAVGLAKKGYPDGAMAGAIGSQVINISLGVGLPSALVCMFGKGAVVVHDNVDSIWLLTALLFVVIFAYMAVTLPVYRCVTCTIYSAVAEAIYDARADNKTAVRTHMTKMGALFLLSVYLCVYVVFFFQNQ